MLTPAVLVHAECELLLGSLTGAPVEYVAAQLRAHVDACLGHAEVYARYHADRGHAEDLGMSRLMAERADAWAGEIRALFA